MNLTFFHHSNSNFESVSWEITKWNLYNNRNIRRIWRSEEKKNAHLLQFMITNCFVSLSLLLVGTELSFGYVRLILPKLHLQWHEIMRYITFGQLNGLIRHTLITRNCFQLQSLSAIFSFLYPVIFYVLFGGWFIEVTSEH